MLEQEIRTKIIKIIAEDAEIGAAEISQMTSFDGVIDSLTLLVIISSIEKTFDIKIEDEQIQALGSLDDAVQFVFQQASARQVA